MKRLLLSVVLFFTVVSPVVVVAQSEAVTSRMSFNITNEVKPPLWQIVEEPYFSDADGNRAIDANEQCKIVMKVKNIGKGDGVGLTAKISVSGTCGGISVSDRKLPVIKVGETATVEFPFKTDMQTADGEAEFTVYIDEPLGFNTESYKLRVRTRKFQAPLIVVKDYVVSGANGGVLEKQKPFSIEILLQNIQYGLAENVTVELKYPQNVFNIGGQDLFSYPQWRAGEAKKLNFELLVNGRYEGTTLPLKVVINDKYGKYGQNKDIVLNLNQPLADSRVISVAPKVSQQDIADVQLRSDVDRNIPRTGKSNPHRFAIIIGNQDYHSQQRGLSTEQDVPFAAEDARMFKEYCEQVLGVEARNIAFLTDATAAKMNQEIDLVTRLASLDPQAEILFYYAGHGLPDERTKEPYLIPVDVNASSLSSAIALYDLYQKLGATNARRITVFLDACFSGGGRDMGLLASRGVSVTPKKEELTGNIVVFSATSDNQTALPYWDRKHGMFTYFLLKKLQESEGECSYSELSGYLSRQVGENSLRENRKDQNPEVNTSRQVSDVWGEWKF